MKSMANDYMREYKWNDFEIRLMYILWKMRKSQCEKKFDITY